ncbi:SDR family NAD(P)-dependent oxidoreductase [Neisseria yangbaofengii]|uniref:SDR family NAD(P)-dependent oxidoreductase n=1 Tax=Neisseria yangbaofengii TaxID=2709396 RepID=UPI0013ECDB38|nr:SDR family NAD(P)-dependent oxidoreductase [Neisseria yangbaofengii]
MRQKIIITGHSSGLGKALAAHYLQADMEVLGIARRKLPTQNGLQQIALDLADLEKLSAWLQSGAIETFMRNVGELVLINNAGTVAPCSVCGKQRPSEIVAAVSLNITAPLLLSNHVLAAKAENQTVKMVHISSGAGRNAYQGWSVYGTTKAALDHHARCVEAENHRNVKVCSIAPGVVDTDIQAQIRAQDGDDFPILPRFRQLHANQQLSSPESVAEIIAEMIADADFGDEIIQDVRTWQSLKQTFQTALSPNIVKTGRLK